MRTFGSNREFNVYRNPLDKYQAVKVGWSWPGFLVPAIWGFVKRLWGVGCAVLAALVVLSVFGAVLGAAAPPDAAPFISAATWGGQIGIGYVVGLGGNSWRDANLLKRGYVLVEKVSAANPESAIAQVVSGSTSDSG